LVIFCILCKNIPHMWERESVSILRTQPGIFRNKRFMKRNSF
jgi:hypothetical protein